MNIGRPYKILQMFIYYICAGSDALTLPAHFTCSIDHYYTCSCFSDSNEHEKQDEI